MNDDAIAKQELESQATENHEHSDGSGQIAHQQLREDTCRIVIAATFTADPLREPLKFWMETIQVPAEIVVAPYAQVMQELLDPQSLFGGNARGFNVLLINLDDWIRDRLIRSQLGLGWR